MAAVNVRIFWMWSKGVELVGVKAFEYVVIDTPVPAVWDKFLVEVVGVMRGEGAPHGTYYRIDDRPFRFWVRQAENELLAAAGYRVESEQELSLIRELAEEVGCDVKDGSAQDAAARKVEGFLKIKDPSGNCLEFFHGDMRDGVEFKSPANVSGFVTGDMGLGHAVFAAPTATFEQTHAFYNALGFRDTDLPKFKMTEHPDDPGMRFAFMHAQNGRHHSIAIGEMDQVPPRCVHLMLEMKTMSDVGQCHDRMRAAKITESATIGRHVNDQTFGFYMQTPGGYDLEIGCDPLVIDPGNWEPTAHKRPSEWGHVWAWQKAMENEGENQ